MPREAAACGRCVITGLLGSAANDVDVPIPRRFKLDVNESHFFERFKSVASEILENFAEVSTEFDPYRREIFEDPAQQEKDFLKIAEDLKLEKIQDSI